MKLPIPPESLPSRVALSYIFDYGIIIFFIIAFSSLDAAEPFHQHFSLSNISIQYPYALHDRVPAWLAAVIAVAFPAAIIAFWTLLIDGRFSHSQRQQPYTARRRDRFTTPERLWELNCGILGLLLSVAAAVCVTGALKNATGKPRPDLIARCQPKANSRDADVFGLVSSVICTGDPKIIKDGFKSFPSGHSSTAFAGLGYLSIWLAGKLHVLDNRGEVWKTVLVLVPFLAASLIAISRIMDARHHPFDVVSSSLLGTFVAWLAYRQYFPALTQPWKKGRAYPIRSWGTEIPAPQPGQAAGGFEASAEEGRAGYDPVSKTRNATGTGADSGPMENRRQYLEEQESLAWKRTQAHGYDYLGPPGESDPVGTYSLPGKRAGGQGYSHPRDDQERDRDGDSGSDDSDTFELRSSKVGPPPVPRHADTSYQAFRRADAQTPATTSTQDVEDRNWSIAQATSAITGSQVEAASPPSSSGLKRVDLRG